MRRHVARRVARESTGDFENDLAELASCSKAHGTRRSRLQPEYLLDRNANPLRRDQWQDLALDEAGGGGLVLEWTSPQRGAVNVSATAHELQEVDLAACTCADADDRETASDGE